MTAALRAYRCMVLVLAWGTGLLLVAVTILVLIAAGVRYLGISPGSLHWVSELTRFGVIWLVMLGAAVAHDQGAHVAIEISGRFPPRVRRLLGIVGALIALAFLAVLFVYGLELSVRTMRQLTPALKMPVGYAYLALPAGAFLMLVQTILFAVWPDFRPRQPAMTAAVLSGGP